MSHLKSLDCKCIGIGVAVGCFFGGLAVGSLVVLLIVYIWMKKKLNVDARVKSGAHRADTGIHMTVSPVYGAAIRREIKSKESWHTIM